MDNKQKRLSVSFGDGLREKYAQLINKDAIINAHTPRSNDSTPRSNESTPRTNSNDSTPRSNESTPRSRDSSPRRLFAAAKKIRIPRNATSEENLSQPIKKEASCAPIDTSEDRLIRTHPSYDDVIQEFRKALISRKYNIAWLMARPVNPVAAFDNAIENKKYGHAFFLATMSGNYDLIKKSASYVTSNDIKNAFNNAMNYALTETAFALAVLMDDILMLTRSVEKVNLDYAEMIFNDSISNRKFVTAASIADACLRVNGDNALFRKMAGSSKFK